MCPPPIPMSCSSWSLTSTSSLAYSLAYSWSVSPPLAALPPPGSSLFTLPPFTLRGGHTYVFTVLVSLNGSSHLNASAAANVTVVQRPLLARIVEGEVLSVSASDLLVLDASISLDPDRAVKDQQASLLTFSWVCSQYTPATASSQAAPARPGAPASCTDQVGAPLLLPTAPILTLPAGTLSLLEEQGAHYFFTVSVSDAEGVTPPRTDTTTVRVSVRQESAVPITLAPFLSARHDPAMRLRLRGSVAELGGEEPDGYIYSWSVTSQNLDLSRLDLRATPPGAFVRLIMCSHVTRCCTALHSSCAVTLHCTVTCAYVWFNVCCYVLLLMCSRVGNVLLPTTPAWLLMPSPCRWSAFHWLLGGVGVFHLYLQVGAPTY